jgi:hypothetical protein
MSIVPAGGAVAFRAHNFRQTIAAKKNYITKTAKDNMRRVNPNGFNPYAVLTFARKIAVKSPKAPVVVILAIGHYSFQDFQTWNLPPKYFRWNYELNCLELAKRRYLAKGEKLPKDVPDRDAWYYPPENELEFVALPPGTRIEYSDFNGNVSVEAEDGVVRIMDLAPKIKNPEQMQKYPDDPNYSWTGQLNLRVGKFNPIVAPAVMCNLPAAFFHLNKPNSTAEFQRMVLLKFVDQFDDSIEREIANKVFTITSLIFSGDDDNWAFESKEAMEQKKPYIALPDDAPASAKKRTTKCMKLLAVIEQKPNAESNLVESISAKLTVWENIIEAMYRIHDVTLWFKVMRFVAHLMAPAFIVGSVGRERTETSGWNQNADEEVGELIPFDDEPPSDEPATVSAAAPSAGSADGNGDNAEEDDFASLVNNKEQELKSQSKDTIEQQKIDFFLDISVQKGLMDTYDAIRRFLVPVTGAWVKTTVMKHDGKKDLKNYIAPTNGKHGKIEFKKPGEIPEVVCVSEHFSPENINILNDMVAKGQGEYRVAVNTTTYVNDALSSAFVRTIRTLTAEEGSLMLDGKAIPNKPINWVRPENAAYVLYFLHYFARKDSARAEALNRANELLGQLIRPGLISSVKPAPTHGRDISAIVPSNSSLVADGGSANGSDILTNLGAAVAQGADAGAGANSAVQTVPIGGGEEVAAPVEMIVDAPVAPAAPHAATAHKSKERRLADDEKTAGSGSDAEGGDKKKHKKHRDERKSSSRHK